MNGVQKEVYMRNIKIVLDEQYNKSNCYECAQVTVENEKGVKQSRLVTVESLMEAFMNSTVQKPVNIPVGRIPFGYYDAAVGKKAGKYCAEVVTVLPAGKQMIQYEETRYDICMPSLVFHFKVEGGRINSTYVYVIKDEKPTDDSGLYRYPFGNVSELGQVCWGSNVLPAIRELKNLEEAMMLFIQCQGNSDFFKGKKYCGHENMTLRELYEMLKDRDEYPEEYLVAMEQWGNRMQLKDLLSWKETA